MPLVGNGFTTTDSVTGKRISCNVQMFQPWPQPDGVGLNSRFATEVPGPNVGNSTSDVGFAFANCGDGPGHIIISKDGYETLEMDVTFPIPTNINYKLILKSNPVIVKPLSIDGKFFRQGGERQTIIECSDFSAFKYFTQGKNIRPVVEQRRKIGFNTGRVWLLNTSVIPDGGLTRNDYPECYKFIKPFCNLYGEYDMNVEFTIFTQAPELIPNRNDQQNHLNRSTDEGRGLGNVIFEQVNENDHGGNINTIFLDLVRPTGVILSRGSNGADAYPVQHDDPWDYEEYHTNGLPEFQRKVGHNAMELSGESGKPCIANENTRFIDDESSKTRAYDAAMGGALLCAGSCYHSQNGKLSLLYEGLELECAQEWARGALSVPLEFQAGSYQHRTEFEGPGIIRAYSRTLSDGREHLIRIRA